MEGKAADAGDIKPFFHLLVFDDTQAVFSPRTLKPSLRITPPARNPIPETT